MDDMYNILYTVADPRFPYGGEGGLVFCILHPDGQTFF